MQIVRPIQRGNPNVTIISESGLYAAILRSRKPEAKVFRKWVTAEVLPSIHRHGVYMTRPVAEAALTDRTSFMEGATRLAQETVGRAGSKPTFAGWPAPDDVTGGLTRLAQEAVAREPSGQGIPAGLLEGWPSSFRTSSPTHRAARRSAPYSGSPSKGIALAGYSAPAPSGCAGAATPGVMPGKVRKATAARRAVGSKPWKYVPSIPACA